MKRKLFSIFLATTLVCSSMAVSAEELGQTVVSEETFETEDATNTEKEIVDVEDNTCIADTESMDAEEKHDITNI